MVLPTTNGVATGRPHRDCDYSQHEPAEINFWVPLTDVWGANSLQLESVPGAGDFHAATLGPGQVQLPTAHAPSLLLATAVAAQLLGGG